MRRDRIARRIQADFEVPPVDVPMGAPVQIPPEFTVLATINSKVPMVGYMEISRMLRTLDPANPDTAQIQAGLEGLQNYIEVTARQYSEWISGVFKDPKGMQALPTLVDPIRKRAVDFYTQVTQKMDAMGFNPGDFKFMHEWHAAF